MLLMGRAVPGWDTLGTVTSLISAERLVAALPDLTVLDVRWRLGRSDGAEQYAAGHIAGAAYVDLETDLADPPGPEGRHPLPDAERFAAAMRRCGVHADRPVVVYDDWSGLAATRGWWLLRYHGHREVRVLDGGWKAWLTAGGPAEAGARLPRPGDFAADPGHLPVVDADGAARVAEVGVLLDARAPERFRGDVEPVDPVAGHIPGAVNVPATVNLHDGRFRDRAELAAAYGCTRDAAEVAVYCGSGVTATHDVLALHELGREAALYPGSWSGWLTDPTRPVAVGSDDEQRVTDRRHTGS
jgi:thiosulfate/3-mercaptopyruvate sulfurtransferase